MKNRLTIDLKKSYDDYWLERSDTVYTRGEKPKSEYVSPYKESIYLPISDSRKITKRDCYNKLGKLEDIEERIDCPLEVLLQVFRKGIFVKSDCTKGKIEYWHPQQIKVIDAGSQWDICKIGSTTNKYVGCFNYKKTWALTEEELK